jgi:hypothetical protein
MNVLSYALPCRGGGLNIAFVRLVASLRIYSKRQKAEGFYAEGKH